MSENFWKRLNFLGYAFALAALFCLIVLEASVEIKDLDLWLHLASGKFIVEHGFIPNVDIFSVSILGKPWLDHEWLFQVILDGWYRLAGFDGLISLQVSIITLTFALLFFLGYRISKGSFLILLLLFVLFVYKLRFTLRPDIFSLLILTLYFGLIPAYLKKRWILVVVPFLQFAWTNLHGYYIWGIIFILVTFLGEAAKKYCPLPFEWSSANRLNSVEVSHLKKLLILTFFVSWFNPYGFEGLIYPFKVLVSIAHESKIVFQYISELQRPIYLSSLFSLEIFPHYKFLILISLVLFLANGRRLDVAKFIFWVLMLIFSLLAVRNIIFFAFVAYFACLDNFKEVKFKSLLSARFKHALNIIFSIGLGLWIMNYFEMSLLRGYFDFDKMERKSEFGGVSLRNFPYKAVDFLVQNKIKGNFFNDFNSGAYLIGRCFPGIKVFIDGRTEVYGGSFFEKYQQAWEGNVAVLDESIKQYSVTGAFLGATYNPIHPKTLKYFHERSEWKLVYLDYDAVIFLKDIPQNKAWIERYHIDPLGWQVKKMDLLQLGLKNITPFTYVKRADILYGLGAYDSALNEAEEALRIDSRYADAYKVAGKILIEKKEYDRAYELLRKGKLLEPANVEIRYYLAISFYYLGEIQKAFEQNTLVLKDSATNYKGLSLMSLIYAKKGEYPKALEAAQEAFAIKPQYNERLIELGEYLFHEKQLELAKKIYTMALEAHDKEDVVHNALGLCYLGLGNKNLAKEEFEKALSLNPKTQEYQDNLKQALMP